MDNNFLLYTLNNGIMAYIVKDNVELHSDEYNENELIYNRNIFEKLNY